MPCAMIVSYIMYYMTPVHIKLADQVTQDIIGFHEELSTKYE